MSRQEIWVTGINVAGLHSNKILDKLIRRLHGLLEERNHHLMEFLLQLRIPPEGLLVQQLAQNAHKFVIDQRSTFQAGILESLDLLLHNQFKSSGADEECWRGTGRVVKNGANVNVLDLIEGVESLDTVRVEFVEHKADTSTTGELNAGNLLVVSIQDGAIFVAEFRYNVENNVCAISEHAVTELVQFGGVFLQGCGDASLDIGKGLFDVHHKDLSR